MKWTDYIRIGGKIVKSKILQRMCPLSVEFGITYRCNLACKYCLLDDPASCFSANAGLPKKEMSLDQVKNVLLTLSHMDVERINISGGEPLFRRDIDNILETAFKLRHRVSLTSNGILVKEYIDLLTGLDFLVLSINGGAATHNYLSGADSHLSVVNALDLCKSRKMQVFISSVITSITTEEDVRFVLKLSHDYDSFCVLQPAFDGVYFENGYFSPDALKRVTPSSEQVGRIKRYVMDSQYIKRVVGGMDFLEFLTNYYRSREIRERKYSLCMAGNSFFYISPSGDMYPCSLRFRKLLDKKLYEYNVEEIYKNCQKHIMCSGCCCYSNNLLNDLTQLNMKSLARLFMRRYV